MVSAAPLVGFVVVPVAAAVVYAHAGRRGRSERARLVRAGLVGVASLGGFLLSSSPAGDALIRAYLAAVKGALVLTSPYELLVLRVAIGVGATALAVLVYGFESRYGRT